MFVFLGSTDVYGLKRLWVIKPLLSRETKAFTLLEVVIALAIIGISWHCWCCGVTSVIQGGEFQSGFLSAGFSQFAGPHINIYHEMTRDAGGLHMRMAVRDKERNLLGAMGLGRAEGVNRGSHLAYGNFFDRIFDNTYEFGKEGNGQIHAEKENNQWLSVRILSTTPAEDQRVLSYINDQNEKTGPYNIFTSKCWDFSIQEDFNTVTSIVAKRYGYDVPMGSFRK